MDELLNHCLRELAFEGDFGSNVSRLRDFILEFYTQTGTSTHTQNPDDTFCSFVWSLVVQQPTVLIGLIPIGLTSEVWIAPQTSAKRKAKALGVKHIETSPSKLDPITDPKTTPLDLLRQAYGERLRIAAEPKSIFSAITGTHIRSSKMSPMVYSALQIITRGRDTGVTVVELGRQSGYDQKTCFYLVRQLTDLDLVVKVRRGGVGTHFCIHRYFFSRNLSWKAIRDEEIEAEALQLSKSMGEPDLAEDEDVRDFQPLTFTPIDARHLSSLPLISARVVRLLKTSKNHIHASNNMLITLGFSNPTKTDRRFFQSRIREMIQQRIIEKVIVPSNKKKAPNTAIKCFRLVEDAPSSLESAVVVSDLEEDIEDIDLVQHGVKMNITIHKQIIDLLESSGTRGMTLNELSHSLFHFDKRTIELLLARADKFHPPSHLSDLSVAGLMETNGRERRHRYFTVANYCKLVSEEALDKSSVCSTNVDLVNIGRFNTIRSDSFYENVEELVHRQDVAKNYEPARGSELQKTPETVSNLWPKRGRPRKPSSIKEKEIDGTQSSSSTKCKRKAASLANDKSETSGTEEPSAKRRRPDDTDLSAVGVKRSRPRSAKNKDSNQSGIGSRKRGRPSGRTEVEDLPAPSSIPQSDFDNNFNDSRSGEVRASKQDNFLRRDTVVPSLMSVPIPPDPIHQELYQPTQKQQGLIIANQSPTLLAISENQSAEEQRTDDPMPPLSPCTETETGDQNASHTKPAIVLQAGSITFPLPQASTPPETIVGGRRPIMTQTPTNIQVNEPLTDAMQSLPLGTRVNVSHLRRENELLRLVESSGGIVNIQSKDFFQGHLRLLKSLAQSGEPTSAPVGTKIDKRTAVASLNSLERKGRLKQLKTSIMSHIGANRPACIVYLPDIEQNKLNAFLVDLARGSTVRDNLSETQRKSKSQQTVERRRRNQETKALLAKKAEEARKHREQEWQTILQKNHPDTLTDGIAVRIERIRNRFLQAGSIKNFKWEKEIQAALREADLVSTKIPKLAKRTALNIGRLPSKPVGVQSTSVAPPKTSIQALIDLQGPPITEKPKPKRKRKEESNADSGESRKSLRRHRFQWNSDFDELAKDASAIIRARCRGLPRLDWAAFEQVFPAVPRNTVRQRLSTIRETPGNETYLRRLEDNWYDLWMKHKGTSLLPDDDDRSPSNFDLLAHLEFLRANVDKNALRVGFAQATEATILFIPADIEQLQSSFDVLEAERTAPDWEFMWNAVVEEGREKKLKQMPLSRCPEQLPCSTTSENDKILIAQAALKITMGTPSESYNSGHASCLLRSQGEDVINIAIRNLLSRGILSKSQRDPTRQAPGRQLKISEMNQNAIGGSISPDIFQDASALLDVIESSDVIWHIWPLTATDGDCATLLQLVSENKVEFNVDTSLPRAARAALDWNSKKADDDQIETTISVCYHRVSEFVADEFSTPLPTTFSISPDDSFSPTTDTDGHGFTVDRNPACCRRMVLHGLVDCTACLNEAWSSFSEHLIPEERDDAQWVIDTVCQAGETGIKKSNLMACTASSRLQRLSIVNQMVEASIPQVYWTGYETLALVSAHFIAKWSVSVTKDPMTNVFPRRWLDIRGNRVPSFWQAALRAVMGSVIFRPGISQAEIRWRLRSVYDRQEVMEIICCLQAEGYLQFRVGHSLHCELSAPFDEEEENCVYWFSTDKHWYQV